MNADMGKNEVFVNYYAKWIHVYKEGAVRDVTMNKYRMTLSWVKKLAPDLQIQDMTRMAYQQILNDYAAVHERQTTLDFHHHLKCAVLDAVDDGLIARDPTRKAIIKGKTPREKKKKYLNQFELHRLLTHLTLGDSVSWDWLIWLIAKSGLRFSEALAMTPDDFDFSRQMISVNKTWDYKGSGGFLPTKNQSSVRTIQMDWQTMTRFAALLKGRPGQEPFFVRGRAHNSTANAILSRHCRQLGIPVISIHGLRHTHASLLLFAGVSIASVARRLGHASMTTTQKTYLHVIRELESRDIDTVMRFLSSLG
ncbi:site-specific integrase [uncultured Megasphaera sp.]|uniref:site-specific integrase n=1 Tax=uncultured Megasphaera sp. TaxID=165188 RepID=UPI00265B7141|nr:site-specific integrase [uncultured Megasphaera sp.]